MFKSKNFCHIASNNRNQVKVGVFTYRTTDSLTTVLANGYFNERIIDINLHDLIIHEKIDALDNTKVVRNLLCVTERTLENVGTTLVKSDWENGVDLSIADLYYQIEHMDLSAYVKTNGTSVMTGPLLMRATDDFKCAIAPYWDGIGFFKLNDNNSVTLMASLEYEEGLAPATDNKYNFGTSTKRWKDARIARVITGVVNNGYDIAVPVTNSADTLALKSEVDLAANSGRMITDQGVWYAKMYAATVAPSAENGTNYADFSQVDGQGNPVIVIYERQSGAWVQSETITPPAEYDGYVPITSKIWDIAEQTGQQGGRILWNHQSKDFTPYPQIISFENAALTGVSTAPTPTNSSPNDQIANKEYVDNATANSGSGLNVGDIFLTMRNDNELNGAVECDGATYNTTDFTGAQSIGALLEDGKIDYISLSAYSTAISTKGWCDKIGWDGAGNTAFRVPTLNAHIVQTNNIPVIGNGMTLGLTDGTNESGFNVSSLSGVSSVVFARYKIGQNVGAVTDNTGSIPNSRMAGIVSDPTKSGVIADTSDTAQLRVMVQLATSASDEAVETCTGVLADVAALKYDYVVDFQAPTAQNNYTWYRKYKSGWVEQGVIGVQIGTSAYTFNLPVTMSSSNYEVLTSVTDTLNTTTMSAKVWNKTTTSIQVRCTYQSGSIAGDIRVCGMSAN